MFWAFEGDIFEFFANFWVRKLKPFSREVKQSVQNYLNRNSVKGSFFENCFERTFSWKTNVVSVWKGHLSVFRKFLSGEVETLFWESEAKRSKSFNPNLVIERFLENGFEGTLSWKTNVLSIWKGNFSVFCKFWRGEVETIFWESEAKHSKLFKSEFGHRKLLRKWFWSYLDLKNDCSQRLKRVFFSFFPNFWVTKLKTFSWKGRQNV